MAGGHETLRKDPAIERWVEMRHDLYKNFKWNGKTTRAAITWGLAVPVALYYLSTAVEGKYYFRGVARGESITQRR